MALTARDRSIIDFEGSWWKEPGRKAAAIRERLGLSPARYYELLAAIVNLHDADTYDPLVVRRVRRLQARRRRARIEGPPALQRRGR